MALTKLNFGGSQTALTASSMPSGSVIQTVTTTDMTAASYANIDSSNPQTFISASITPTATNSKILLTGFISVGNLYSNYNGTLHYVGVRLKRGSTVIGETSDLSSATTVHGSDATGARPMHSVLPPDSGYNASRPASVPFHFVDLPSTTFSTTYNIQGVIERDGYQYTMLKNIGGYNYNTDELASATCQLTLQEIKG